MEHEKKGEKIGVRARSLTKSKSEILTSKPECGCPAEFHMPTLKKALKVLAQELSGDSSSGLCMAET